MILGRGLKSHEGFRTQTFQARYVQSSSPRNAHALQGQFTRLTYQRPGIFHQLPKSLSIHSFTDATASTSKTAVYNLFTEALDPESVSYTTIKTPYMYGNNRFNIQPYFCVRQLPEIIAELQNPRSSMGDFFCFTARADRREKCAMGYGVPETALNLDNFPTPAQRL